MHAIQHHARGVLSAAAIATAALVGGTFATPASAQWASDNYAPYAAPATGVVVGTLAGVVWYVIARDRPEEHSMVSREELEHIQKGIPDATKAAKKGRIYVSVDNSLLQAGTDIARTITKIRENYLHN